MHALKEEGRNDGRVDRRHGHREKQRLQTKSPAIGIPYELPIRNHRHANYDDNKICDRHTHQRRHPHFDDHRTQLEPNASPKELGDLSNAASANGSGGLVR